MKERSGNGSTVIFSLISVEELYNKISFQIFFLTLIFNSSFFVTQHQIGAAHFRVLLLPRKPMLMTSPVLQLITCSQQRLMLFYYLIVSVVNRFCKDHLITDCFLFFLQNFLFCLAISKIFCLYLPVSQKVAASLFSTCMFLRFNWSPGASKLSDKADPPIGALLEASV